MNAYDSVYRGGPLLYGVLRSGCRARSPGFSGTYSRGPVKADLKGLLMCSESTHGTPGAFLQNLRAPMPLGRKIHLVFRNSWIKISRGQSCCGHPGEPGC